VLLPVAHPTIETKIVEIAQIFEIAASDKQTDKDRGDYMKLIITVLSD